MAGSGTGSSGRGKSAAKSRAPAGASTSNDDNSGPGGEGADGGTAWQWTNDQESAICAWFAKPGRNGEAGGGYRSYLRNKKAECQWLLADMKKDEELHVADLVIEQLVNKIHRMIAIYKKQVDLLDNSTGEGVGADRDSHDTVTWTWEKTGSARKKKETIKANPTAGAKSTKERIEKVKETAKSAATLQPAKKPTGSSAQIPMPIPGTPKPRKNAVGGSQVGSAMEEMVKSEEKRAEATDRQRQQERAQEERNLAISQNIERAGLEMEREKAERDRGLEERKLSAVEVREAMERAQRLEADAKERDERKEDKEWERERQRREDRRRDEEREERRETERREEKRREREAQQQAELADKKHQLQMESERQEREMRTMMLIRAMQSGQPAPAPAPPPAPYPPHHAHPYQATYMGYPPAHPSTFPAAYPSSQVGPPPPPASMWGSPPIGNTTMPNVSHPPWFGLLQPATSLSAPVVTGATSATAMNGNNGGSAEGGQLGTTVQLAQHHAPAPAPAPAPAQGFVHAGLGHYSTHPPQFPATPQFMATPHFPVPLQFSAHHLYPQTAQLAWTSQLAATSALGSDQPVVVSAPAGNNEGPNVATQTATSSHMEEPSTSNVSPP